MRKIQLEKFYQRIFPFFSSSISDGIVGQCAFLFQVYSKLVKTNFVKLKRIEIYSKGFQFIPNNFIIIFHAFTGLLGYCMLIRYVAACDERTDLNFRANNVSVVVPFPSPIPSDARSLLSSIRSRMRENGYNIFSAHKNCRPHKIWSVFFPRFRSFY